MLRWLPQSLVRLYRRLLDARPYARNTRPRLLAPEAPDTPSGLQRKLRLDIAQDAFCHHRPKPRVLFRLGQSHRLDSWCEQKRGHRCPACAHAHTLYVRARDRDDWKAECKLHRLARRGVVRLLAERREYRHHRRVLCARVREEAAASRQYPPETQEYYGLSTYYRPSPIGYVADRRAVEAALLRAHARHLRRETQKRRLRKNGASATAPAPVVAPRSAPPPIPAAPRPTDVAKRPRRPAAPRIAAREAAAPRPAAIPAQAAIACPPAAPTPTHAATAPVADARHSDASSSDAPRSDAHGTDAARNGASRTGGIHPDRPATAAAPAVAPPAFAESPPAPAPAAAPPARASPAALLSLRLHMAR
ncbi:MAG TPA: hypothetical protein VJY39_22085 [Acidisphaera sp.]|nr:hypothetical protein [Acidisphaera sp.]